MESVYVPYTGGYYGIILYYAKSIKLETIYMNRFSMGLYYYVLGTDNADLTVTNYTSENMYFSYGGFISANNFAGKRDNGRTSVTLRDFVSSQSETPTYPPAHLNFEGVRDVTMERVQCTNGGALMRSYMMSDDMNVNIKDMNGTNVRAHYYFGVVFYFYATDRIGVYPRLNIDNLRVDSPNSASWQLVTVINTRELIMSNVYLNGGTRAFRYNCEDGSPYWYGGQPQSVVTMTNWTITNPAGQNMAEAVLFHTDKPVNTLIMKNISVTAYTTSYSMFFYHWTEMDLDGIYINGGPLNNAVSRIYLHNGLPTNGTTRIRNIEFDHTTYGGVFWYRVSSSGWPVSTLYNNTKIIVDGMYMHDCTNVYYGVWYQPNGVTGSLHPESGVYNSTFINNVFNTGLSVAYIMFDRSASFIPEYAITIRNITMSDTQCAAGCTARGIDVRFPTSISNINIRNIFVNYVFFLDYYGAFKNTTNSLWSDWEIKNNFAYTTVMRISIGTPTAMYADHPYPNSTGIKVFCNHVKHTTWAAGYFYTDKYMKLNLERWGGQTFDLGSNHTNRHMWADSTANGLINGLWPQGEITIQDKYLMQIRTLDFGSYQTIPKEGGLTMKIIGDWILSYNSSYGVYATSNVTFRGIPVRDVKAVYDDEAYFVLGAYNETLYSGNELLLKDTNGHQGLMCTDKQYATAASTLDIYPSNYSFTGIGNHDCHAGLKTLMLVSQNKYVGAPLVSIRCNLNKDGFIYYGDWFTPDSTLDKDMRCWMPCDQVEVGQYTVSMQVLGNVLVDVAVLDTDFQMTAHEKPLIAGVSSRYIVDSVTTYIYGENFPQLGSAMCKYNKNSVSTAAGAIAPEFQGVVINSTTFACFVTSLNSADSPSVGTYMDLSITFWGPGSGWFAVTPNIVRKSNYIYYNYDYEHEERPFVYVGTYAPKNPLNIHPNPLNVWTIGRPRLSYTSQTSTIPSGVYPFASNLKEPMICMFHSEDGNITFVQPTSYTYSSYTGYPVCDIPPSPGNQPQITSVWIGYWFDLAYQYISGGYQVAYRYNPFKLNGLLFDRVTVNQYVIFDGVMNWQGYSGYGGVGAVPGTLGTNCTTALCYCRYEYLDASTGNTVANTQNGLIYHGGMDSYRCILPQFSSQQIRVSVVLNGWELGRELNMVVRYATQVTSASLNHFNGDIGTRILVTGSGFIDSQALMCGFARTTSGEYPGVFDGRKVYCYDNSTIQAMVASRAVYINDTNIMCVFDSFIMAKNDTISGDWYKVDAIDAWKYVCLGAYHTVYAGNTPDGMIRATNDSQQYQYMRIAQAKVVEPTSANYLYQENVHVHGSYIAALGIPICWWSQLLNNNTAMPPSPDNIPQGMFSRLVEGTFVILQEGNQVRCPLPKVDGIAYVGVVVSNNGRDYNTSAFGIFRYMSGMLLQVIIPPSNVTVNTIPLAQQPVVKVSDVEGNLIEVDRTVEVNVRTVPSAYAMSGTTATADNSTGLANFTNLRIEGPQYASYNVCFQASTFDSQSPWTCVCCTSVESCPNMFDHGVEYNLGCVCDIGYQMNAKTKTCELCPLNRYRSDLGTDMCTDCPNFKKTLEQGATSQDQCVCKDGFIPTDDGSCVCPPGSGFVEMTQSCWPCASGSYKDVPGNTVCTLCTSQFGGGPVGANSSTQCTCQDGFVNKNVSDARSDCVCPAGFYFNEDSRICSGCQMGWYKATADLQTTCSSCAQGETTATSASTRSTDCMCKQSFVRAIDGDGTSPCVCDRGYEYDDAIFFICQSCPPDAYKEIRGSSRCKFCDASMRTRNSASNSSLDCECREGYYVKPDDLNKPGQAICSACPMGGYCKGGKDRPVAKPGYYVSNSVAEVFVKCQVAEACVGQDMCAEGYEGYKCGDCELGFYRKGSRCVPCTGWAVAVFYMCAIIFVIFLAITFWMSFKPPIALRLASLRIGWSFIQITALYAQFDLNWPPEIKEVYRFLSFVILDIQITSPECSLNAKIDFYSLLIFKMLMPIVFGVLMAIIYGLSVLGVYGYAEYRKRIGLKEINYMYKGPSVYKFLRFALVRSTMVLLVMFYVPLVQFVLQYFDCTWQDDGSWSLDAQPSVHCYEGKHMNYFPLVLYGSIVYVMGIPLFCARVLWKSKDKLLEPFVFARYGFLYARFKPKYFYWEIVLMIRLCVLVMCLMLVNTHVPVQTMTGITVLFMSALQHKDHKPFITEYLNKLETMSLVASVLTLLAGQVFYAGIDSPFIITILTVLVLLLLLGNIMVVGLIIYLEWKPPEDPYKDFNDAVTDAPLEVFESNAGGLVVTMEMGMDSVGAGEDMFSPGGYNDDMPLAGSGNAGVLFDTNAGAAGYDQVSNDQTMSNAYSSPGGQTFDYSTPGQQTQVMPGMGMDMNQMGMNQMDMNQMGTNQMGYGQQYDGNSTYQQNTMGYNPSSGYVSNYDQTQNGQYTQGNDTFNMY
jgi:hypothetical protein